VSGAEAAQDLNLRVASCDLCRVDCAGVLVLRWSDWCNVLK